MLRLSFTWVLIGLLAVAAGAASVRIPLTYESLEGCSARSGWVRLNAEYRQQGAERLIIEAEEPTGLSLETTAFRQSAEALAGMEAGASGGRYLAYIDRASYALQIATPGVYQVWYRAWFPWVGGWNHRERIVGQLDEKQVMDCNAGQESQLNHWTWVKGPTYTLAAGRQTWELSYTAGARLDQMIFTPDLDWKPEGEAPLAGVKIIAPAQGVAITRAVQPAAVRRWEALEYLADLRGGTIEIAVSTDNGASYQPLPANGNLTALPARGDGTDRLRTRFTFHPAPDGRSPVIQSVRVRYDSGRTVTTPDLGDAATVGGQIPLVAAGGTGYRCMPVFPGASFKPGYMLGTGAYQPDAAGCFWLEAESPSQLDLYPSNSAVEHRVGAVGGAIFEIRTRPLAVRYDLQAPADGEYTLYLRMSYPFDNAKDATAYFSLDDGPQLPVTVAVPFKTNTWQWVQSARTLTLTKGLHTLRYAGGLADGYLDRLCLAPAGAPPPQGEGGAASVAREVKEYAIRFFPVCPPRGAKWAALALPNAVQAEVSADGGKSWQRTTDLSAYGDAEIQVRVTGNAQFVPWAIFTPGGAFSQRTLPNGIALFDRDGSLYGLYHTGRGEWVAPPGMRAPAFTLAYQVPGMARLDMLTSADATLTGFQASKTGWQWTYELLDGGLTVTTSLADAPIPDTPAKPAGSALWDIQVKNNTQLDLRQVQFPVIPRLTLDGERMDDELLFPEGLCGTLRNPYSMGSFSYRPIVWPGTADMAWTDLADAGGGVYLAAYQQDMLGVEFNLSPNGNGASLRAGFTKQIYIGPGEQWAGTYRLALHAGDWHAGADLYRRWADSWMDAPVFPAWLRNCDAYLGPDGASGRVFSRYATHAAPLLQWMGINYVQQWAGTADGEFCGLHPGLNPRFGRIADARKAHDDCRKLGIHYTYYINDQGWYPGFTTTDHIGYIPKALFLDGVQTEPADFFDKWGLRTFGGSLTDYGAGVGYTNADRAMCVASIGWQGHFVNWLGKIRPGDYHADGSYIDQAACLFNYCYGEDHGHGKQHAAWGLGNYQMMKRVTTEAKRRDPDAVLGMEGVTDVQAPYAWGLWVSRITEKGENFLYTRPRSILFRGTSNGQSSYFRTQEDAFADSFLYNRFDGGAFAPWFRDIVALRGRVKDWMYAGRFMDMQGLTVEGGPVEARWFLISEKGRTGAVINLHNWTGVPDARVTLQAPALAGVTAVLLYTDDGKAAIITPRVDKQGISFTAPTTRCSSALLIAQAPPAELLRAYAACPQDAGADRVVVTLTNLDTVEKTLRIRLTNARAFGGTPREMAVRLPAHSVQEVTLPLPNRAGLTGMTLARIRIQDDTSSREVTAMVPPVLTNGGFETDVNADRVPDNWGTWNIMAEHEFNRFVPDVSITDDLDGKCSTVQPFAGKYCLQLPPAFDYEGTTLDGANRRMKMHSTTDSSQRIFLRPGTRYHLRLAIRADAGAQGTVSATLFSLRLGPKDAGELNGAWKTFEGDLTTPADYAGFATLTLLNETAGKVWFDAVELTEVKGD